TPQWFAEGLAQFQLPGLDYENWDSQRDMLLRTAIIQEYQLSLAGMGVFGKNSIGSEMVYNHGFSMIHYIDKMFGFDAISELTSSLSQKTLITFNQACKKALGISQDELYEGWKNSLTKIYTDRLYIVRQNVVSGEFIFEQGTANFYPVWSPDGRRVAYLSNKGESYLGKTSLLIYDFDSQKAKRIKGGVRSSVTWSPDGKKIAYARLKKNKAGSHYIDLFSYNLAKEKETRLTEDLRLHSPDWSPDGKKMVCINNSDGTNNLFIFDLATEKAVQITDFSQGEQVYHPRWSHNGKVIVYATSIRNTRDIMLITPDGKKQQPLIADEFDSRNPIFTQDDQSIIFSYDKTGIYNLYKYHLKSKELRPLTNVLTGAFMPTENGRGQIVYSQFDQGQFKLAYLKNPVMLNERVVNYLDSIDNFHNVEKDSVIKKYQLASFMDGHYDDAVLPDSAAHDYRFQYQKFAFLPRIMYDYGTVKLGTYLYSSDILNQYNIFAGVVVNSDFEHDVFAMAEYRKWAPTLFVELYSQRRKTEGSQEFIPTKPTKVDYNYQLLEGNIGARLKIIDPLDLDLRYVVSRYSSEQKFTLANQLQKMGYPYLKGQRLVFRTTFDGMKPYLHSSINPIGFQLDFNANYEMNKFIEGFKVSEYSTLVPAFHNYKFMSFNLDYQHYKGLFHNNHTIGWHLRAGYIDHKVDSFFNYFAGGLTGMRGYPFYSIEGRKLLHLKLKYGLPLWRNMDIQLAHLYLDKLYATLFYDYGSAFDTDDFSAIDFRSDAGAELRLNTVSFYSYPAYIFLSAAYGWDEFPHANQIYGKEWRYHFGVSFGYWE
ncbi:PD40 domain-containing protein, partial [bacterium]|nr:PD40 domain-containing protein [bacterium]